MNVINFFGRPFPMVLLLLAVSGSVGLANIPMMNNIHYANATTTTTMAPTPTGNDSSQQQPDGNEGNNITGVTLLEQMDTGNEWRIGEISGFIGNSECSLMII